MHVCESCMCSACGCQKKTSDHVELARVISRHMLARMQYWSSERTVSAQLLSHLSSPNKFFYAVLFCCVFETGFFDIVLAVLEFTL